MPFRFSPIDDALVGDVKLVLTRPKQGKEKAPPGGGPFTIPFQFPPEISSDNKAANWDEDSASGLQDPFALFAGAKAREIDVKWTYIVIGSKKWNVSTIAGAVKAMRGYFLNITGEALIVKARFYEIVGSKSNQGADVSFRSEGVNVSHAGPIVKSNDGFAYHLRTNVSMKLKSWTDLQVDTEDEKAKQQIKGLGTLQTLIDTPDWY